MIGWQLKGVCPPGPVIFSTSQSLTYSLLRIMGPANMVTSQKLYTLLVAILKAIAGAFSLYVEMNCRA